MPGLDGPELCRRVRSDPSGHYTYIVLITSRDDPAQVLEGMNAGADDYLIKPVDPFAVQTRLVAAQRVIDLHRQLGDFRSQLEHANLELLELSRNDALTGLGNRRRMEEDLQRAHARALRTGLPYGLTLFDIDHFKLYNDHYGHVEGDEGTLQRVALPSSGRRGRTRASTATAAREFLLLLPDSDAETAAAAAERIRGTVSNMAIPHLARPTTPHLVTVSAGISCWTSDSTDAIPALLHQADQALFHAKATGRNRVEVAEPAELAAVPNGRR